MNYIYECDGRIFPLEEFDETVVEHKKYFCVVCTKCSNVPVLHMLERGEKIPEGMWKNKKTGDRLYGNCNYDPEEE